jgi:DNA-directed RNA polymerase specialized sigma24 family protein
MDIPPPPRDDLSFRDFYRTRRTNMMGLVRFQAMGRLSDPESVAQEAWRKFYPHWSDCRNPDAYVRRCIISETNNALRKAASEPHLRSLDELPASALVTAGPITQQPVIKLEDSSWDPELAAALTQLSDALRETVLLDSELNPGERSVAEIAAVLRISRVAAHMRLHRAYAELRGLLPDGYLELRKARRRGRTGLEGRSAT